MEPHIIFMGGFGLLILLVAWVPILIRNLPLSLPIICIAIGFAFFSFIGEGGLQPRDYPGTTEVLTELTVIISLAGAGLRIDEPLKWRVWANTRRLLGITMPLTIVAIAALAVFYLGLPWETAVLIGAVVAPTDPVLAADVQVGPPRSGPSDDVRFSLTSEAGLNDGLAFPFTFLALAMVVNGPMIGEWTWHWFTMDVLWRIAAGTAAGCLFGWLLGVLMFRTGRMSLAMTGQGFAALGGTFITYAGTEAIHGYGFIAVFVCALVLRAQEDKHDYHIRLHDFTEEIERLLMMVLLVLFGGSLAGPMLDGLTWKMAIAGLVILFVIRPVTGMIGLLGSKMHRNEKAMVSLFGIRGVGSFYYLAYAVNEEEFGQIDTAWALVSFIVLVSIIFHGVSSGPLMSVLDRQRKTARKLAEKEQAP
ncbi:cation:proton antiporter [Phytohalomonas tamaricis]|uniref:cation:proton antiporter n=1 Tax=Phytohalomonas tamaricis TaxID=2081032 RepID=UPI000D0BC861|nr:sodium:proton antiporter [Phytohalomonas tamaricis]